MRFSQNAQQAADGKVSYFTYDRFSRMIRSGEVTRAFASLDPSATYAFETDTASWTSRYIYDVDDAGESGAKATWPVGRPTRIEQNTDAAAEVTARIAYDPEGRMTSHAVGEATKSLSLAMTDPCSCDRFFNLPLPYTSYILLPVIHK